MVSPTKAVAGADGSALGDERQGTDWLTNGRTYLENHHSPLMQINAENVKQLGLAWFLDLPHQRALEATPLAIDGVLYFSGTNGRVFAVCATDGKLLWEFDPQLRQHAPRTLRYIFGANRGVAYWKGKIFVGVVDGRLVALDAKSGKPVWSVQTFDSPNRQRAISGAPRVFNGKVIIGYGGADLAGTRGYVTAYDAETGRQLWRFYTVPGDPKDKFENPAMELASKTWRSEWLQTGAGGAAWDSIVYDQDLNRIYFGTANSSPILAGVDAANGDKLFTCSIIALDADTGRYVWHYQESPGDQFEYDATGPMVLADLRVDGQLRKVLMQAPKDGFFYIIDRRTGKLISADKYEHVTWADHIDLESGRPVGVVKPASGTVVWPKEAHNWPPMSFNPANRVMYIPTMKWGVFGFNEQFATEPDGIVGGLLAWDVLAKKKKWEVGYDSLWNGGTLSTAGNVVFQGTGRGHVVAYNAASGAKLWDFNAGLGIIAAPITYEADGTQYVSILVGYGGQAAVWNGRLFDYGWRFGEQPRRLLTFALGKRTVLPPGQPPRFSVKAINDPSIVIDAKQAEAGAAVYRNSYCFICHGGKVEDSGSIAPDLRESRLALNFEALKAVLHEGKLADFGMPKFDDLTDEDVRALHMYIRQRAREAVQAQSAGD
jgi:quinohemoprotein ethanol dehydrogenase